MKVSSWVLLAAFIGTIWFIVNKSPFNVGNRVKVRNPTSEEAEITGTITNISKVSTGQWVATVTWSNGTTGTFPDPEQFLMLA